VTHILCSRTTEMSGEIQKEMASCWETDHFTIRLQEVIIHSKWNSSEVHGRGVGTRWSSRSFPTQTLLWFYDMIPWNMHVK